MLNTRTLNRWLSLAFTLMLVTGGATGASLSLSGCDLLASLPFIGNEEATEEGAETEDDTDEDEEYWDEEDEEDSEEGHGAHSEGAHPQGPMATLPYSEIKVAASDDMMIYARVYDPTQQAMPHSDDEDDDEEDWDEEDDDEEAETEPVALPPLPESQRYPIVVLLHMLGGSYSEWKDLPADLVKQGYAVVALDLRGHGQSAQYFHKTTKDWRDFSQADWLLIPRDVQNVVLNLKTSPSFRHLNTQKMAIIGASLGANAAILYSETHQEEVKALVLLSPGLNYKGLETPMSIVKFKNAVFLAASQKDSNSFEATDLMYKWVTGPKAIRVYRDVGHGSHMLIAQPALKQDILAWLQTIVPGNRHAAPQTAQNHKAPH